MDENDIGLQYMSLCERLQLEISEAEYCSMFPKTHIKMTEWLHEQGSANEFQPKLLHLFQVIEEDLINQWSNPYLTARTKNWSYRLYKCWKKFVDQSSAWCTTFN